MVALGLAAAIVIGYAAALWRLLRGETAWTYTGLVALTGLSLLLRLVAMDTFPPGLNEDEPKVLYCAAQFLDRGWIFREGCTGLPVLLNAVFQAQLIPWLGPTVWAIRLYSIVTSVLATPAAFAVGRIFGLRVAPSLAVAAFIAVLPWSLFFGRVAFGGELVFHEMLLLAGLARLVFAEGNWKDAATAAFGQTLLLYDYFCGRTILPLAVAAAAVARGRRRWLCLAVPVIALLAWVPYLLNEPKNALGGTVTNLIDPAYAAHPLAQFALRARLALRALALPEGLDGWFTVRAAAVHPWLVLALAVLGVCGSLRQWRLVVLLLAAFCIGLAPAMGTEAVNHQIVPSVHRMMMALPAITFAAGCALNLIPWPLARRAATLAVVCVVSWRSISFFFSPAFWSDGSRAQFDHERTGVVAAIPLPPHVPLVVKQELGYFFDPRKLVDSTYALLRADNWYPPDGPSLYAFDPRAALLLPFYQALLGPERVHSYGRAFLVDFESRDWSWLRRHGWSYEAHCGAAVRRTQVPVLYHAPLSFDAFECEEGVTHIWRGRWRGPEIPAVLRFTGFARIETSAGVESYYGEQAALTHRIPTGSDVTVSVVTKPPDPRVYAALLEAAPGGDRLPAWEWVDPVADAVDSH